jgi:hypothetical protein
MSKSAYEMWHEHRSIVRRQEYLDFMVQVLHLARQEKQSFIVAQALMACAAWMYSAGRLKEARDFYEQRLDPAVWHEDKLEIQCVRDFIRQIDQELNASER